MDETEVELNKFVNLEFDNTGVFAVFVDIRQYVVSPDFFAKTWI